MFNSVICQYTAKFSNCDADVKLSANVAMKKRSEETQTLRAGCSKAGPKISTRRMTLFLGARDGQNLISWRWSLPLATNSVWRGSMQFRVIVVTDSQTHPRTHTHTDRTDYNTLRRSFASA